MMLHVLGGQGSNPHYRIIFMLFWRGTTYSLNDIYQKHHKTKRSSVVAHPSLNNKVVGSNPRNSIFFAARQGLCSSILSWPSRGCLGAAGCGQAGPGCGRPWPWRSQAGPGCGRPGLAWARPRPTTTGWDLADRGQGVVGRGRSQPLPPFVIFFIFSIFHCIYNMAMCYFFDLFRVFSFLDFFHS
jgi:hypothetical protein